MQKTPSYVKYGSAHTTDWDKERVTELPGHGPSCPREGHPCAHLRCRLHEPAAAPPVHMSRHVRTAGHRCTASLISRAGTKAANTPCRCMLAKGHRRGLTRELRLSWHSARWLQCIPQNFPYSRGAGGGERKGGGGRLVTTTSFFMRETDKTCEGGRERGGGRGRHDTGERCKYRCRVGR